PSWTSPPSTPTPHRVGAGEAPRNGTDDAAAAMRRCARARPILRSLAHGNATRLQSQTNKQLCRYLRKYLPICESSRFASSGAKRPSFWATGGRIQPERAIPFGLGRPAGGRLGPWTLTCRSRTIG